MIDYTIKVSVIIAVFDNKEDIINAINSVINQTYKNWEIIIIDDCSTDGTYEIIENFIKTNDYQNIFLFRNEKNYGVYVSTNIALQKISGDCIIRLDSDDTYHQTILEKQVAMLYSNDNYMACQSLYMRGNLSPADSYYCYNLL
jgi:glycosyltransferase involved in cell wall biosynthesis